MVSHGYLKSGAYVMTLFFSFLIADISKGCLRLFPKPSRVVVVRAEQTAVNVFTAFIQMRWSIRDQFCSTFFFFSHAIFVYCHPLSMLKCLHCCQLWRVLLLTFWEFEAVGSHVECIVSGTLQSALPFQPFVLELKCFRVVVISTFHFDLI